MRRSKYQHWIASALVLVGAAGCGEKEKRPTEPAAVVRGVRLVQVQQASGPDYIEALGTVRAVQASQLSSQIVGVVVAIHAREGQRVRKGDVLVTLDDAQQRAALERASAAVASANQEIAVGEAESGLANSTLARYQSLYEKKSVSPHEFEQVQARAKSAGARNAQASAGLAQAKAAEAQARAELAFTRIRAPFGGVITEKRMDAGTLAAPGVPLLTVEDTSRFRLEATVDEGDIAAVKLSAAVPVVIDALGKEFPGKVVEIVPSADPQSRTFLVKIGLPPDVGLRSGLFGRARISRGERQSIRVPRAAVLDRGQLQAVYVVGPQNIASLRYVTLGRGSGDEVEILSGLQSGETLIAEPGERELAGRKIEP